MCSNYRNILFSRLALSASIVILTLGFFLHLAYTAPDNSPPYVNSVISLQASDLPIITDDDLKKTIYKLEQIFLKWKNSKIDIKKEIETCDFYKFYNSRIESRGDSRLKTFDIINLKKSEILKKVKSFPLEQKQYALQTSGESPRDADKQVMAMYLSSARQIKMLKNTKGNPIIRKKSLPYYSYTYLHAFIQMDIHLSPPERNIYLTNTLILDDASDLPIHTFIRGGLVNGFCNIDSKSMIISYFPLYNRSKLFANESTEFTQKRTDILAYIIAHEMAHCCFGMLDDFKNPKSFMSPPHRFEYLNWLKNID